MQKGLWKGRPPFLHPKKGLGLLRQNCWQSNICKGSFYWAPEHCFPFFHIFLKVELTPNTTFFSPVCVHHSAVPFLGNLIDRWAKNASKTYSILLSIRGTTVVTHFSFTRTTKFEKFAVSKLFEAHLAPRVFFCRRFGILFHFCRLRNFLTEKRVYGLMSKK